MEMIGIVQYHEMPATYNQSHDQVPYYVHATKMSAAVQNNFRCLT